MTRDTQGTKEALAINLGKETQHTLTIAEKYRTGLRSGQTRSTKPITGSNANVKLSLVVVMLASAAKYARTPNADTTISMNMPCRHSRHHLAVLFRKSLLEETTQYLGLLQLRQRRL